MKKPKESKAPVEPIAPSKTIKQYTHIDITSIFERGIKLDQLSNEIDLKIPANVNPSDITFRLFSEMVYNGSCDECGGYDSSPMAELFYYKEINNPEYGAQLAKYFIDNEDFKVKLINYNSELAEYNSLKLEHDELQKNRVIKDKIKELENLKKQVAKLEREVLF